VRIPQKRSYTEFFPPSDVLNESEYEESPKAVAKRLERIRDLLQQVGYRTIFDACVDELQCNDPAAERSIEDMKSRDVMAHILEAFSRSAPMGPRPRVAEQVCTMAEKVYAREARLLATNSQITGPTKGLNANELEEFSFKNAQSAIEKDAPRLLNLFTTLSERKRIEGTKPGHDGDNEADDSSGGLDSDSEEWLEKLNLRGLKSLAGAPEPNHTIKSKTKSESHPKRKKLVLTVAICVLMYARSQRTNLMQSVIGFYLQSSHCPKEVLTVLHQLGLCIRYETTSDAMERIVTDQCRELQKWAKEFPAFTVCSDNANWKERKRDQRLDNQSEMRNMMTAYIFRNPWTTRGKMFTVDDSFRPLGHLLSSFINDDLKPSNDDERHLRMTFQAMLFDTLFKYCGEHMRKHDSEGNYEKPFVIPKLNQLPSGRPTKLHCLPAYDKNEVEVTDLNDVTRSIIDDDLGYTIHELGEKLVPFTGDLYTVNLLRYTHPTWQQCGIAKVLGNL